VAISPRAPDPPSIDRKQIVLDLRVEFEGGEQVDPPSVVARGTTASHDALDRWAERIFSAETLDALFDG